MAAMRGPAGIGSELDEALVRAGRHSRRGVVSADARTLQKTGGREADSFYRDRLGYDKVVRSAHGVNCTGSCSWKVYVKDGIITWEAQQTDYPSAGPDRPDYEPRGAPGKSGFVRASWDKAVELAASAHVHTIRTWGPDRIAGFTPIPAMSMVSHAAGARFHALIGAPMLSFYDWYADLPVASPQVFGDQTGVPESGDWWDASYLVLWGSNAARRSGS